MENFFLGFLVRELRRTQPGIHPQLLPFKPSIALHRSELMWPKQQLQLLSVDVTTMHPEWTTGE